MVMAELKNYITPQGRCMLQQELDHLWQVERPQVVQTVSWAASNGDRSENGDYIYGKKRLREIDRRVRFLRKRLDSAVVVDPAAKTGCEQVFFGAQVSVIDEEDQEHHYQIVGIDEANAAAGRISWISPLAKALLGKHNGDVVEVKTPEGSRELEILAVVYESETAESTYG